MHLCLYVCLITDTHIMYTHTPSYASIHTRVQTYVYMHIKIVTFIPQYQFFPISPISYGMLTPRCTFSQFGKL